MSEVSYDNLNCFELFCIRFHDRRCSKVLAPRCQHFTNLLIAKELAVVPGNESDYELLYGENNREQDPEMLHLIYQNSPLAAIIKIR